MVTDKPRIWGVAVRVKAWIGSRTDALAKPSLMVIVVVAMAVAAMWMVRVPFMQETDEQAHADYAYALYDGGGWFSAPRGVPEDYVTAQVQYLASVSNFWQLRTFPSARVPAAYGTRPYFDSIDRSAPGSANPRRTVRSLVPFVAYNYPVGYYVVAAAAMRLAAVIEPQSITATYFAARSLGVLFLGVTLLTSFAILRELQMSTAVSLLVTAAVAMFPLSSWVSGYIQPDTLVWLLATLALYFALRWRAKPFDTGRTALLILTLTLIFFVKTHYALALAVSCWLMVAGFMARPDVRRRTRVATAVAFLAVPMLAYLAATNFTPVGHLSFPRGLSASISQARPASVFSRVERIADTTFLGVIDTYLPGGAFRTFWLSFGDLITPYLASEAARSRVMAILSFLSLSTLLLMLVRQARVCGALARVARRHGQVALRLFLGDIVLNVYVVWVALLLAVFVTSSMTVYLEGRYFLPILLPTILLGVRYVPRLFPIPKRKGAATVFAAGWALYSLTMSPVALSAMENRFYGPTTGKVPTVFARVVFIQRGDTGSGLSSMAVTLHADTPLTITGLAFSVDKTNSLQGVSAVLDRRLNLAVHPSNFRSYNGTSMLQFSVTSPAELPVGQHTIEISPEPRDPAVKPEFISISRR
jgi:hypothetical protein